MGLKGVCLYAVFRATLPNARLNVPKKCVEFVASRLKPLATPL